MDEIRTIEENQVVSKAFPIISQHGSVVVLKNGAYAGVLDDRMLLGFKGDPSNTMISKVYQKTPSLEEGYTFEHIVNGFLENKMKILPVVSEGEVTEIVTREDAMRFLLDHDALSKKTVKEAMNAKVVTIDEKATIAEARKKLVDNHIFKLVVTNAKGNIRGVLSVSAINAASAFYNTNFREGKAFVDNKKGGSENERIENIMRSPAVTIQEGETLADACKTMLNEKVSLLIVESQGKVKGVLAVRDVLKAAVPAKSSNVTVHGLRNDEKAIQASIIEETSAFMEKYKNRFDIDSISLHIKSAQEGVKRRYEVKAVAIVDGKLFHSKEQKNDRKSSMWDAHLAVKETLAELKKVLEKRTTTNRPHTSKYDPHRE